MSIFSRSSRTKDRSDNHFSALIISSSDYRHRPMLPPMAGGRIDPLHEVEEAGWQTVASVNRPLVEIEATARSFVSGVSGATTVLVYLSGFVVVRGDRLQLLAVDADEATWSTATAGVDVAQLADGLAVRAKRLITVMDVVVASQAEQAVVARFCGGREEPREGASTIVACDRGDPRSGTLESFGDFTELLVTVMKQGRLDFDASGRHALKRLDERRQKAGRVKIQGAVSSTLKQPSALQEPSGQWKINAALPPDIDVRDMAARLAPARSLGPTAVAALPLASAVEIQPSQNLELDPDRGQLVHRYRSGASELGRGLASQGWELVQRAGFQMENRMPDASWTTASGGPPDRSPGMEPTFAPEPGHSGEWSSGTVDFASSERTSTQHPSSFGVSSDPSSTDPMREQAAREWQRISGLRDPSRLLAFARRFPGPYGDLAQQTANLIVADDHEAFAWQQALVDNTDGGYRAYLASWPHGSHAVEADARRRALAVSANVEASSTDRMTPFDGRKMHRVDSTSRNAHITGEQVDGARRGEYRALTTNVLPFSVRTMAEVEPVWRDNEVAPELVLVQPGEFVMGAKGRGAQPDESPLRRVAIGYPIGVGRTVVTFAEWDAACEAGAPLHRPRDAGWGRGQRPVINVSWFDAIAYVRWLSDLTAAHYRLITEAEWEFCARAGGRGSRAPGMQQPTSREHAHYSPERWGAAGCTVEVGSYRENALGLFDMLGLVSEWTLDTWRPTYDGAPCDGRPVIGARDDPRVVRGGAWCDRATSVRSTARRRARPTSRNTMIGFRVVRLLPSAA